MAKSKSWDPKGFTPVIAGTVTLTTETLNKVHQAAQMYAQQYNGVMVSSPQIVTEATIDPNSLAGLTYGGGAVSPGVTLNNLIMAGSPIILSNDENDLKWDDNEPKKDIQSLLQDWKAQK